MYNGWIRDHHQAVNHGIKPNAAAARNDSRKEADKQMLARYRRIEELLKTNLPEARKQYGIVKAMQLSVAADESQAQANIAAGEKAAIERKRRESSGQPRERAAAAVRVRQAG